MDGDTIAPRLRKAPSSSCLYWPQILIREVNRSFRTANLDLSWVLSAAADWAKTWSAISRIDVTRGSNWLSWACKSFRKKSTIVNKNWSHFRSYQVTWNFVSWAFSCFVFTVRSIGSALCMSASVLSSHATRSRMVRWYSSFCQKSIRVLIFSLYAIYTVKIMFTCISADWRRPWVRAADLHTASQRLFAAARRARRRSAFRWSDVWACSATWLTTTFKDMTMFLWLSKSRESSYKRGKVITVFFF